jgi:hypothetical protein
MINDFKLGFKIIKYGLNFKVSVIASVLMLFFGCLMDVAIPGTPINGLYVGMVGMFIMQMICSVSVSTMVQSSSRKRQLQTSVPAIVCSVYLLFGNTISIILKLVGLKVRLVDAEVWDWEMSYIANGILFNALFMVIIVLYNAGATKVFWQATVCFIIIYLVYFFFSTSSLMEEIPFNLSIEAAVVISYLIIIVASVLIYFLFVAMYKRDYSKQTFEMQLNRAK